MKDEEHVMRLVIMLESVFQQNSMLRFSFKQAIKRKFTNFDNYIESMLKEFKASMDKPAMDYYERSSILYLEAVNEIQKSKDPAMMLALMKSLNEGLEIKVEGTTIKYYDENQSIDNQASIQLERVSA